MELSDTAPELKPRHDGVIGCPVWLDGGVFTLKNYGGECLYYMARNAVYGDACIGNEKEHFTGLRCKPSTPGRAVSD